MALATVAFPYFSRLVAEENWSRLRQTLTTYTRLIVAATVPLTITIVVLSEWIVRVLFQRGEFTAADTAAVAEVQATLALMIPFYALAVVYSRVLVSMRKSQLMLICSCIVFVANVVGDYVFKELIGVQGIALATVVNFALQFAMMYMIYRRVLRQWTEGDIGG
jgi:putative peptidoglycan lipid II flippase